MSDIKSGFRNIIHALKLLIRVSPMYLILTLLLSGIVGLLTPLSLWIWQNLVDSITQSISSNHMSNSVILFLGLSGGIGLLTVVLDRVNQYVSRIFANIMEYKTTENILLTISNFTMEQYDDPETYDKINMAIKETPHRCLDILGTVTQLITCIFQLIGCALLLASFGSIILVLSTISAVPLFWTDYLNNKYWFAKITERVEKNRLISFLKELLIKNENIKEIRLFQNSAAIIKRITDMYGLFLSSDKKARKIYAMRSSGVAAINIIIHFIVNTTIIIKSIALRATIGQITMQISSAETFRSALNLLVNEISTMHDHSLYIQSLIEIESSVSIKHDELISMPNSFREIVFDNVSFVYPGTTQTVLKEISLKLHSNRSYAIVGLNGSGKTTLLKLLLKMYTPTSGSIYLDGVNINDISSESYYQSISAIFQDFIHFPFSVRDNITGVASTTPESSIVDAASLSSADKFINELPRVYNSMLMKEWNEGVELSLGQWQMIAISRCFCRDALIYILDEPFSALDPLAEIEVIKNVSKRKDGKLCLFITHRMTSIVLADEIVVLERGELKGKGTHTQLVKECVLYKQLYDAQADAIDELNHR